MKHNQTGYTAPEVELVEIVVEQGFYGSDGPTAELPWNEPGGEWE